MAGALGVLLVSFAATWMLSSMFADAARDSLDRQLDDDLISLLALTESGDDGRLQMRHVPDDLRYDRVFSGTYWQIFDGQGVALLQSRSLWDYTLAFPAESKDGASHAFDLNGPMQQPLRGLVRQVQLPRAQGPLVFVVAVDRGRVAQDVADFRRHTAVALAVLTALWLAVLITQIHFGLRPLDKLGETAARVRAGEDARFPTEGLPSEVRPLARHLNELLDYHSRMVVRARNSAADLAHALKTPLSILVAESEGDDRQWRVVLREQSRRMHASIERYLAVGATADMHQRTKVHQVAMALSALMRSAYRDRQLVISVHGSETAVFAGAKEDLEEILGNLMDNACKWAASTINVAVTQSEGRVVIDVADDGPGLPTEKLEHVLGRGVRLDEREPGNGLGLAIVEDIAGNYGGTVTLTNRQSGLCARLDLPSGN
ncbi:ATP-binding protein [Pseudoxanthomonas jiangsuensis]|uniref:ATP-binding protein n=1 Tax=Pseudoxanthomonas jiangsuensis TaxID=619688 RepID=UPI001391E899|nr:HAMP domain-containing sensor histidine kinase [Pseudoxanthomonas jiangsuensis]KAF1697242.1 ATP-binding protein [Pseudoxanthomonas jiangsuensis]